MNSAQMKKNNSIALSDDKDISSSVKRSKRKSYQEEGGLEGEDDSVLQSIRHESEEDIEAPTPSSSGDLDSNGIIERENITYSYTDCIERKLEERIEDFADLNEGEMKFFKLWNRYLRSLPGVGAVHMPAVVLRFVETHGLQILELNLYRNFTAHLTTLKQFNIIGVNTLLRNVSNKKMIGGLAIPHMQSSWQNMWSLNTSPGLKEPEAGGPESVGQGRAQVRDENENSRLEETEDKKVLNFFSRRIAGAGKTLKEFQEEMARTSRIMKEGLRHPTTLKERSWIKVDIV